MSVESSDKAEKFLAISSQYKLGSLVTESSHPSTKDLSNLAKTNPGKAIDILKELDVNTLRVLSEKKHEIYNLKNRIRETLVSGNNVFFCGCGSTGRLSLTIETLWRQIHAGDSLKNRVFSFMTGGDVALISSIENFEDFTEYGVRQLMESGFRDGDLLVASTEGGETPFVIGAVEKAAQISYRKPFFLYCNPDELLFEVAERSKRVILNDKIEKFNLTVGPMGITGSTRMQSSTILLAAGGLALLYFDESDESIGKGIDQLVRFWNSADISFIDKFIILESDFYKKGDYLLYETDNQLGISIITDTTERSPTFSLYPFENVFEPDKPMSFCYLYMPDAPDSQTAWTNLLWRDPRTLEWPEIGGIASKARLLGFDFSVNLLARRKKLNKSAVQHIFKIMVDSDGLSFALENERHSLEIPLKNPLFIHLVLKMILNTHSTLIMGRIGRYEGNVMTYVRASNNKLIDRAIRYIDMILKTKSIEYSYSEICHVLYEMLEITPSDSSIVLATVAELENRTKK